ARDLERSNKDLSQFAHIVAHDLKEPLRGMEHFAQFVLEDEPGLSQDSRSKLGTIMRLAQRTTATIEGLLQLARVGTGDLKRAPVDLHEVAEEILDSFRPQLESAGARASIQSRLPVLECDRVLVAQAIANLVSNAIKYNDK